jgi:hypothetical protein
MPDNNMMIMLGLGAAALWFMNRGGSQEDQVDQLAGASMMASGEGTTPDAPFQEYSAPANPVFFFNQGGQMAQVPQGGQVGQIPGTNVPIAASAGEDIGVYPGGQNRPELEFTVARSNPPIGTTDISPTTPEFAGNGDASVTASTVWDQQALIATENIMPLIGIETTDEGLWNPVQSNVDIANLSSKESFRAVNLDTGHAFTTNMEVMAEYVRGFAGSQPAPATNAVVVSQTVPANAPDWAIDQWWDEG